MDYSVTGSIDCRGGLRIGSLLTGTVRNATLLPLGATVEATVIFSSNRSANVRLSDGAVVRARLEDGVVLREGETVFLTVLQNDGQSVVLEVSAAADAASDLEAGVDLSKAGPAQKEEVTRLSAALKQYLVRPDVALLEQAAATQREYPYLSADAAVFAAVNKIELNPESAKLLDALSRSDFKVGELLLNLSGLIAPAAGKDGDAPFPVQASVPEMPERGGEYAAARPVESAEGIGGAEAEARGILFSDEKAPESAAHNFLFSYGTSSPAKHTENVPHMREEPAAKEKPPGSALTREAPLLFRTPSALGERGNGGTSPVPSFDRLFFAEAGVAGSAEAVKKAGEELFPQLRQLMASENNKSDKNREFLRGANRLLEARAVFRSFRLFTYQQIPVKINAYRSTAEVYVFRRQKSLKKENPEETSLLLALDTDRLGCVEVLVRIRKNRISFRFKLQGKEAAQAMEERTQLLYSLIFPLGYRYSGAVFLVGKDPVTPVNAMKELAATHDGWSRKINLRA